jgi:hypothetical protein
VILTRQVYVTIAQQESDVKVALPGLLVVLGFGGCHRATAPRADAGAPLQVQSDDILARTPTTTHARVREILISWRALEAQFRGRQDSRAMLRSPQNAVDMILELKRRVDAGESFEELEKTYSEDSTPQDPARVYDITANGSTPPAFQALSLRLNPGETGVIRSQWGWHLVQRLP